MNPDTNNATAPLELQIEELKKKYYEAVELLGKSTLGLIEWRDKYYDLDAKAADLEEFERLAERTLVSLQAWKIDQQTERGSSGKNAELLESLFENYCNVMGSQS